MAKEPKHLIQEETRQDRNLQILQEHFPSALEKDPETGGYTLNANQLQHALDPAKVKVEEDGYELRWVGKKLAFHEAYAPNHKLLKPLPQDSESKNFDTTQNILIKADNLDALKFLKDNYFEKIKMIYIDPPYNTQSDKFIYKDNFTENDEDILKKMNYCAEDIEYIKNLQAAKTHTGWLTFIYSRLLLAKDLLKSDGVIFISIDDNEQANLKLLCDEIFGENNLVGIFGIKTANQTEDKNRIKNMDYLLVYAKSKHEFRFFLDEKKQTARCTTGNQKQTMPEIEFPAGLEVVGLADGKLEAPERNGGNEDIAITKGEIIIENGKLKNPVTLKARWSNSNDLRAFCKNVKEGSPNKIYNKFGKELIKLWFNGSRFQPQMDKIGYDLPESIWQDVSKKGSDVIKKLFGISVLNFPKHPDFIKKMLLFGVKKDDIILDFFAGSGTTAHAVMQLNAEDNGNRKFILVQKTEEIPEENENVINFLESINKPTNIFEICAERIRRAGEAIKQKKPDADIDIGFKIFEVIDDDKNLIYNKHFDEFKQSDIEYFETNELETILYSFMAADGIELSEQVKTIIEGKLYVVGKSAYIFAPITEEELHAIKSQVDYLTVYSYSIAESEFYLKLEDKAVGMGFDREKIRIRA